jgi:SAM-dependent methyltransferase
MASADIERNIREWTRINAEYTDSAAEQAWASEEITWGLWAVPDAELGVLGDVSGLDVVDLGCGTAYFSARLARAGARVVAVDPTPAQLETARRMQRQTGIAFPLVEAGAEAVPLPDASFDLVLSEYGASIWCDPELWIPEAARLLRPGGRLTFLRNSTLLLLCVPDEPGFAGERLLRSQFGRRRFEWPGEEGVEFHLGHGEWIDVLRRNGLEVERLIEVQAPEPAVSHAYYEIVTAEWARQWPSEDIWVARKLS